MDRVGSCVAGEMELVEQEEFQMVFGKYILIKKNPNQGVSKTKTG